LLIFIWWLSRLLSIQNESDDENYINQIEYNSHFPLSSLSVYVAIVEYLNSIFTHYEILFQNLQQISHKEKQNKNVFWNMSCVSRKKKRSIRGKGDFPGSDEDRKKLGFFRKRRTLFHHYLQIIHFYANMFECSTYIFENLSRMQSDFSAKYRRLRMNIHNSIHKTYRYYHRTDVDIFFSRKIRQESFICQCTQKRMVFFWGKEYLS